MTIPDIFIRKTNADGTFESNLTPAIIFNYMDFRKLLMSDDIAKLCDDLEELRGYVADAVGFKWGNGFFRFSNIFGNEYTFLITGNHKGWRLAVWDHHGGASIATTSIPKDSKERGEVITKVLKATERHTVGYIQCSACKEEVPIATANKHAYFAGRYCDTCWDSKYKQLEANENYN